MNKSIIYSLGFGLFLSVYACTSSDKDTTKNENTVKVTSTDQLAGANQTFGWNLLKAELSQKKDENVLVSPLSAQIALYMATNGAKGLTQSEMLEMLQCKNCDVESINEQAKLWVKLLSQESGHPTLALANAFFYDDQRLFVLNQAFKNSLTNYDCVFEKTDFSNIPNALQLINAWVNDKTKGKIDKILENINEEDVAFLINALYFKSDWALGFNTELTRDDVFYTSKGSQKNVTYLSDDRMFPCYFNDKLTVVDIPFKDSTYSLTLIDQKNQAEDLNATNYLDFINKVKYQRAVVVFPKVKLSYENDLIQSLKSMGMNTAFNPNTADFTTMGQAKDRIFINQIKHKVVLDIDEKGVEGAAVTSIAFGTTEAPPFLKFDRPFYIVLRHIESNTVVFSGKINDPS